VSNTEGAGAPVLPGLLALAEEFRVPQELRDAVAAAAVPRPSAGQLWRAADGSAVVLGVLLSARTGEDGLPGVLLCPLTLDVDDTSGSGVGVTSPVLGDADGRLWPGLARWLPLAVLDHFLDDGQELLAAAGQVEAAASAAADNPDSATTLLDTLDVFSGSAQALAEVADDVSVLASCARLAVAPANTTATRPAAPLLEALPGSGADKIRTVQEVLGVSNADALAVLRGRRPLSEQETDQVRRHLGLRTEDVHHDGFPPALVAELEQPRWRRALMSATPPPPDLATARAAAAAGVYVLAARDSAAEPNWAERIERYLQAGG